MIPKKIHITWKTKDILQNDSVFVRNCIRNVVDLSGWNATVYDNNDIDEYLKSHLDRRDYLLLKDRHIVEKSDVWRLIKIYNEGGLYVDIDRLCNVSLNDIIEDHVKVLLPTCLDHDFSQDFICSEAGNPMLVDVLNLNLERRSKGVTNVFFLGPQTYFHGITKSLTGVFIETNPSIEVFDEIRKLIESSGFMHTYRETSVYDTILYRPSGKQIDFDHEIEKRKFYSDSKVKHWTQEW
jgi:hypothetical protein